MFFFFFLIDSLGFLLTLGVECCPQFQNILVNKIIESTNEERQWTLPKTYEACLFIEELGRDMVEIPQLNIRLLIHSLLACI